MVESEKEIHLEMINSHQKANSMKPIETISGQLLLYFYLLYRKNPSKLHNTIIHFKVTNFTNDGMSIDPTLIETDIFNIKELQDYSDVDLYNALQYLKSKNFINYDLFSTVNKEEYQHIHKLILTTNGVDIIEGIERGDFERKQFNITFNFNITNNTTIESLLKASFF